MSRKEITLKPISKLIMSPKQKARKSFPNSPHKMQVPLVPVKKVPEKKDNQQKSTQKRKSQSRTHLAKYFHRKFHHQL